MRIQIFNENDYDDNGRPESVSGTIPAPTHSHAGSAEGTPQADANKPSPRPPHPVNSVDTEEHIPSHWRLLKTDTPTHRLGLVKTYHTVFYAVGS